MKIFFKIMLLMTLIGFFREKKYDYACVIISSTVSYYIGKSQNIQPTPFQSTPQVTKPKDEYLTEKQNVPIKSVFSYRILKERFNLPEFLKITYHSTGKNEVTERQIQIQEYNALHEYFTAYCFKRKQNRSFSLDRIVDAVDSSTGEVVDEILTEIQLTLQHEKYGDVWEGNKGYGWRDLAFAILNVGEKQQKLLTEPEIEKAEKYINKMIQFGVTDGTIASAYRLMGEVHEVRGDLSKTLHYFEKALELDPKIGVAKRTKKIKATLIST
jgi:tetratricopeptide (TPR) repeat protein